MKGIYLLLSILLVAPGCDYQRKEQDLQKRQTELEQREKELLLKENALNLKEQEILKREQLLDSTRYRDSLPGIDSSLVARWSVRMTCIETTCTGSAVGDTKLEEWNISYEGNHIIARSFSDNQLNRIYRGSTTGNTIELEAEAGATNNQPATHLTVRLEKLNNSSMEGQREIIRENGCKIVYDLKLGKL